MGKTEKDLSQNGDGIVPLPSRLGLQRMVRANPKSVQSALTPPFKEKQTNVTINHSDFSRHLFLFFKLRHTWVGCSTSRPIFIVKGGIDARAITIDPMPTDQRRKQLKASDEALIRATPLPRSRNQTADMVPQLKCAWPTAPSISCNTAGHSEIHFRGTPSK